MGNSYCDNIYNNNPTYYRRTLFDRIQDKIDRKIAKCTERSLYKPNNFCNKIKLEKLRAIRKMMSSTEPSNSQTFQQQPQTTQTGFRNNSTTITTINHIRNENELLVCIYCQKGVPSASYKDHINDCAQIFEATNASLVENYSSNIRNEGEDPDELLTTICDYCSQQIILEEYNYHLSRCEFNPKNLSRSQSHMLDHDQEERDTKEPQARECAICLQTMENDSPTRFLACAHQFHSNCIEDWSHKRRTCPVCMNEFS